MGILWFREMASVLSSIRKPVALSEYSHSLIWFIRPGLGPNQACTLFGAQRGSNVISGSAYISAGFALDTGDLWRRNFPVLIGFFILFQVTQILALEFYPVSTRTCLERRWLDLEKQYGLDLATNIFTKEDEETKKLNADLRKKKEQKDRGQEIEAIVPVKK